MPTLKQSAFSILLAAGLLSYHTASCQLGQPIHSRYYVEHFGEDEGLPQNSVNSILPDKNDFLWIATEGNITRFNGNRFLNVPLAANITGNNFTRVKALYYKGSDTILAYSASNASVATIVNNKIIATSRRTYEKDGLLLLNLHVTIPAPEYLRHPKPDDLATQGWSLGEGGYFGTVYNKDTFLVLLVDGVGIFDAKGKVGEIKLSAPVLNTVIFLKRECVYLDDQNYLNYYSLSGFHKKELLAIPGKSKLKLIRSDVIDQFFCIGDSVLYNVDVSSGKAEIRAILNNLQHPYDISTVYQKDSNTIVTGTVHNGLYVYKKQYFQTTEPLPNGEADGFYGQQLLSDNHTVLTGTNKLFRDGKYLGKTSTLFLTNGYSSLKDNKGNYWYAYNDRILRAREIGVAPDTVLRFEGLPGLLFQDKQERIWISSGQQFGYFANDKFTELNVGRPGSGLSCMTQAADGKYLIGTGDGLFILENISDTALKEVPEFKSLDIRYIWPEANGQIWICTYGRGFFLITKTGVVAFPEDNGKLSYVHCIIEDAKGYFWLPTNNGLFVTSRESLMSYVRNRKAFPFFYEFSKKHGLRTNEFNGGAQPAYLRLPNGDLSLPSMQGLVQFNPDLINFNFSSSPILVDNIQADSNEIAQLDGFDIKNDTRNIKFSLSSSFWGEKENDLLEYQLVEKGTAVADGSWLPVDESGKINVFTPSYGNYQLNVRKRKGLKADDYLYKVINFRVLPKWYQTSWFLIIMILSVVPLLIAISRWRRRKYEAANRILKGKVNAATMELQQVNNTLEKRVEERTLAIQQAEIKFRTLVEASLVGVYIVQNRKFIYVNPRFEEILGYGSGELIGIDPRMIIQQDQHDIINEKVRQRFSGEVDSVHYEVTGITKEGAPRQLEFFGSKAMYEGKVTIIGTMLDITEKKIAEDQLIKEKDLSQSIIENLPGIFYVFDQNGEYQLWNKNHYMVAGYNNEEMSKMHPTNFIEESRWPDLQSRVEKVFTEGHAELEANFMRKDGTGIPYYFNGTLITYNDKPCIMGVGIDISEQKKAEEQLIIEKDLSQSIINGLPGVFFIFDQNREHLLWNKNFETVTGYNSAELKTKIAGGCIEEKDMANFAKAVEKMYASGNAEVEVTLVNKHKEKIPFYVNGIAITYEGKPCILGIGIDISERKKAEHERERANYLLNERIKELTTLYRAGIVLQREDKPVILTLQDFVSILPPGWQYPDITAARISLGEIEFTTENFRPSPFSQFATFHTTDGTTGKIEVVYLEERPPEAEGPFLIEERNLIDMLADMLRVYFTRREAITALQKSEANLHTIFDNTDTSYVLLDDNYKLVAFNQRAYDFGENELKKSFVVRTPFIDYFPKERHSDIAISMDKVMKGSHINYEVSYPQPDGKTNWYYVRQFPITNSENVAMGMMMAVSDITEKKLMEQQIIDQKVQEQKKVIRAILTGEEKERNKIGQELHDNVTQILAGTKLYLGMAKNSKSGGTDIINESIELIDSAIDEIRALSHSQVTPMKKVNLEGILQNLVDGINDTGDFKINFTYNDSQRAIDDDLKLNVYRIIQEQLNNIGKHAMAKNVMLIVDANNKDLHVQVTDDGQGFDVNKKKNGIGISNMINRVESFNGTINIESSPGNGTRLDVHLPF